MEHIQSVIADKPSEELASREAKLQVGVIALYDLIASGLLAEGYAYKARSTLAQPTIFKKSLSIQVLFFSLSSPPSVLKFWKNGVWSIICVSFSCRFKC